MLVTEKKTSSVDELRILKFSWNYSSINYATKIGRDKSIFPCLYRFSALAMALPPVAGFAEFVPESAGLRYSKIWWFFLNKNILCSKTCGGNKIVEEFKRILLMI